MRSRTTRSRSRNRPHRRTSRMIGGLFNEATAENNGFLKRMSAAIQKVVRGPNNGNAV